MEHNVVEYCNPGLENTPSKPDDLELGTRVASGANAACYFIDYYEKVEDNWLAKVIPLAKYRPSEVDALISCAQNGYGHKNIVSYRGRYKEENDVWIITEYLSGEKLTGLIQRGGLDEQACRKIFLQLVMAVRFIHARHFIHGDIKPANVMFESRDSQNVKLIDFGKACYNSEFKSWKDKPRYTLDYAPPELQAFSNLVTYSPAVDIYGLGATLYTMLVGHPPFGHHSPEQSRRFRDASPAFRYLVCLCLKGNPLNRPTLEEILDSEWLQYTRNDPDVGQRVEQPRAAINQPMGDPVARATAALGPAAEDYVFRGFPENLPPLRPPQPRAAINQPMEEPVANARNVGRRQPMQETVANGTAALAPAAAARTAGRRNAVSSVLRPPQPWEEFVANPSIQRTLARLRRRMPMAEINQPMEETVANARTVGRRNAVRPVFRGFHEDFQRPPQPRAAINQPMERTVANATAARAPAAAARTVGRRHAGLAPAAVDRTVGRRQAARHVFRGLAEDLRRLRPPQPRAAINQPMAETVANATAARAPAAVHRTVGRRHAASAATARTLRRRHSIGHVFRGFPEGLPPLRPPQPRAVRPPQPRAVRPPQPRAVRPPQPRALRPPQPRAAINQPMERTVANARNVGRRQPMAETVANATAARAPAAAPGTIRRVNAVRCRRGCHLYRCTCNA